MLDEGTEILREAYVNLSTERSLGFMAGPIPWTAMVRWARLHQLSVPMTKHFVQVISLVDADFMRKQQRRMETKNPGG